MLDKIIEPAMQAHVANQESVIKQALSRALGDRWTMIDVKERCQFIRQIGKPFQVLTLDGEPILQLHDPTYMQPIRDGDRYIAKIDQQYRFLGRASQT
jgi:hypothetical protein